MGGSHQPFNHGMPVEHAHAKHHMVTIDYIPSIQMTHEKIHSSSKV